MDYNCSGPVFDSLVNPYSGDPLRVKMFVVGGRTLFSSPSAYSTSDRFPTAVDAYRAWNRVNGVEGLKDGQPIVCAYTGEALNLRHDEDGWYYDGGFDPHVLLPRQRFLHFATMRAGKTEVSAEEPGRVDMPARVGKPTENMKRHADKNRTELHDDTVKAAEDIMTKYRDVLEPGPAKVSMHVPGKRRRR